MFVAPHAVSTRPFRLLISWAVLLLVLLQPVAGWGQSKQQKIKELQQQSRSLEGRAQEMQRKKREKLQAAQHHQTRLLQNQRELEVKKRSLNYHEQTLTETTQRMGYLDTKIDQKVGEAARLSEDAWKRLRSMYTGERLSMLQMILEANNISTLLDRIYYKQKIVSQDKILLTKLKDTIEELNGLKRQLARQKDLIAQTIQSIQVHKMQIQRAMDVDRALRNKYLSDAEYYERAERYLLQQSNSIIYEIRRMTAKAPKRALAKSTGVFMWPIQGAISSRFGYRTHPIHRKRLMHTGLDIGGPNGGAIRAADGGQVIFAGWKGGYGKAIMINHGFRGGRSIVTLYGHLSSIHVGAGTVVSKGQVIGAEGSTGYSTGPHLHFEVREDGVPVDPYRYLR